MSKSIEKYIRENINVISKFCVLFLIGVVAGVGICFFSSIDNEFAENLRGILEVSKEASFEGINIIASGIRNNGIFILCIYLSMITVICPLLLMIFLVCKAMYSGIYLCVIFKIYGLFYGIIVSIVCVILPGIFSLIGYIGLCTNVLNMFKKIFSGEKIYLKNIIKHIYFLFSFMSIICFSLVFEQFVTRLMLSIYVDI